MELQGSSFVIDLDTFWIKIFSPKTVLNPAKGSSFKFPSTFFIKLTTVYWGNFLTISAK